MKKRILAIVLLLVMLIGLMPTVALATITQRTTALDLTIQETADMLSVEGWAWDADTKTLTLDGLNIVTDATPAITVPADATIILAGGSVNTITTTASSGTGIYCYGDMTMKTADGSANKGRLTIKTESQSTYGIDCNTPTDTNVTFSFSDVNLNIVSETGIRMYVRYNTEKYIYSMNLNGVEYEFSGSHSLYINNYDYGNGTIKINDSAVSGSGSILCYGEGTSDAIIDIIDSDIDITGVITTQYSDTSNVINIKNSTVNAKQIQAGRWNNLCDLAQLNITGSNITVGPVSGNAAAIEVGANYATTANAVFKNSTIISVNDKQSAISVSRTMASGESDVDARGTMTVDNCKMVLAGAADFGNLSTNATVTNSDITNIKFPANTDVTHNADGIISMVAPGGTKITSGGVAYTVKDQTMLTLDTDGAGNGTMTIPVNTVLKVTNGTEVSANAVMTLEPGEKILIPAGAEVTETGKESVTLTNPVRIESNGINFDTKTSVTLYGNHSGTCNHSSTATVAYGQSAAVYSAPPTYSDSYTHTSYELVGWFTAKTGGEKVIDADGTLVSAVSGYTDTEGKWICTDEATALYAQWQAKTTEITLDANGGSGGAASVTATYGQTIPGFTAPTKTHEGKDTQCHLAGWYTAAEGGTKVLTSEGTLIADIDGYSNHDGRWIYTGESVTLYAHWNHDDTPYYVDIYKEDLTGDTYTKERHPYTGYADEPASYTPPSYEGFAFDEDHENTKTAGTVVAGETPLVLSLYYSRNSYAVAMSTVTGVSAVSGGGNYKYGEEVSISATLDPGYSFVHWDSSTGTESALHLSGAEATFMMPARAVALQPHVEPIVYTINYELNGGTNGANPATYTVEDTVTLAEPSRGAYRFEGWYDNDRFAGDAVTAIPAGSTGDKTLYAKWSAISSVSYYTLRFNVGEGTAVQTITAGYGSDIDLSKYNSAREGFRFTGWFSDAALETPVTAVKLTKNTTVYAGWQIINPFSDVATTDWFYDEVMYVYENGLMEGTGDGKFSPDLTTNRGMIVTILYRLEGEPAVSGENPFSDLTQDWYVDAVKWAAANEIVGGYGDGTFGPEDAITREQLAAILWRYAKYKGYDVSVGEDTNILSWPDALEVSEYAISAMQWATGEGIVQGADGKLLPLDGTKRCEAATMLMRFIEGVTK